MTTESLDRLAHDIALQFGQIGVQNDLATIGIAIKQCVCSANTCTCTSLYSACISQICVTYFISVKLNQFKRIGHFVRYNSRSLQMQYVCRVGTASNIMQDQRERLA